MNEDGSEAVSGIQIAKGDSLMFMVQPKTGLTKGDYSDTLIFESEEDSEVAAQVTAEVSVKRGRTGTDHSSSGRSGIFQL